MEEHREQQAEENYLEEVVMGIINTSPCKALDDESKKKLMENAIIEILRDDEFIRRRIL